MSGATKPAMPVPNDQQTLNLDGSGVIGNLGDCLHFSNVFTLAGFETVNDKLLLEMNQRARSQRENETSAVRSNNSSGSASAKDTLQDRLQNLARINQSPPETRFTAAHTREFSNSASINSSPYTKRQGSGQESPSKRRRAPGGAPIGIVQSPTKPLEDLRLDNKERLEKVSLARQREKQRRDLQISPRRRLPNRPPSRPLNRQDTLSSSSPSSNSSSSPFSAGRDKTGTASHIPPFKLDLPLPRPPSPTKRVSSEPVKTSQRHVAMPTTNRPLPSIPRSQSTRPIPRSVSARQLPTHESAKPSKAPLPAFPDNLPSYARPTQAAMRRSQSINHTLNGSKQRPTRE